jgi:putative redox protein
MTVNLQWNTGMTFTGENLNGHALITSNDRDDQGNRPGFGPMELMALSIGACAGMDVISILKKKRQDVTGLEIQVHSRQAETHPRVWTELRVDYLFTGRSIDPKAVERAIELSKDKYCPTQNMIKEAVEIDYSYKIIEL